MVELTHKDTTIQVEHDADVHLYKSILDDLNLTVIFAPVPPTEVYNRELMVDNENVEDNALDIGKYKKFKKTIGPNQQFELTNVYPFEFVIFADAGSGNINTTNPLTFDGKTVVLHNTNLDEVPYDPTKKVTLGGEILEETDTEIRVNLFLNKQVESA